MKKRLKTERALAEGSLRDAIVDTIRADIPQAIRLSLSALIEALPALGVLLLTIAIVFTAPVSVPALALLKRARARKRLASGRRAGRGADLRNLEPRGAVGGAGR